MTEFDAHENLSAVMALFGHTPETTKDKAAQINIALNAGDAVMAASVVSDQARDCGVPIAVNDRDANPLFPYPDLAPFGQQGLAQFMEALGHLGFKLAVSPAGETSDSEPASVESIKNAISNT